MNRLSPAVMLIVSVISLAFLSACTNNNNGSAGVSCPGATGNFGNASLGPSGSQWAYELSGWITNSGGTFSPYTEVGFITVDGNGKITGGLDDFFGSTSVSGSYSIIHNGTGTINLNITNSSGTQSLTWGITLANPGATTSGGSFAVIEADSFANASGAAYQQNTSALSTPPTGTYVFRTHVTPSGNGITGAEAAVGLLDFAPGGTITGNEDYINSGTVGTFANFPGTYAAGSATGIWQVKFGDGLGTLTYDFIEIDANSFLIYETDATNASPALGRGEKQLGGGFTNASFKGSYAFGSRGDSITTSAGGVNTVGQFTADGNGNITGGSSDFVRDGNPQLGQTIAAGSYVLASNGRITTTVGPAGSVYLVSPQRAFFLVTGDTTRVEDGTIDLQSTAAFSNSSFSGQYALVMGGVVSSSGPLDRTGTVQADGNGNLGWAEQVNSGGSGNSACLSGTYSASANGRVTGSVNTLSNSLVFYMISPNSAYALQGDTQTQISGGMAMQNQAVPVIPGAF